ncbi:GNAT family N-acetyltransferase [Paenibacillus alvei]|uniref:GNAT family N-acetyltransferase n=1 Tax=Paenibacillus alvei TaxID=44250 RepID=UPI003D2DC8EC
MLVTWDNKYREDVIALWNEEAVRDGYKELTVVSFQDIFRSNPYFDSANTFVLLDEEGSVQGFACGCTGDDLPLGDAAGYITCVVLSRKCSSDDHYKQLLDAVEHRFRELGKKQADILFFNPMKLPWYIPNTLHHEHNNAPGVPIGSEFHQFLLRQGYMERAVQQAMYLPLAEFEIPEQIVMKEQAAAAVGYTVGLYERVRHKGIAAMLNELNNPLWRKEIGQATADGVPVVIAAHQGQAVGFAGPVIRQKSGRGYFAGIGVSPHHKGHGLGTILFFKLCEAFRSIGTEYMSLFTGSTNPALRIYEKAGFQTVKQFSIMRKEL